MATFRPDPVALLTGALDGTERPRAISAPGAGGKFTPEGEVLRFPGNTVLCHIDRATEAFAALVDLQTAMRTGPFAGRFTWLPPESFHMTVFQGISGLPPNPGSWPAGVPADTPLADTRDILLERLRDVAVPAAATVTARGLFAGHSVTVDGVDAAAEAALRATRDRLSAAMGIRHPGFDTYTFHITLGYALGWVDDATARGILAEGDRAFAAVTDRLSRIDLGPPEFCRFETMHHFEPLALLGPEGAVRL